MFIKLEGETFRIEDINTEGYLPLLEVTDGCEYYFAESHNQAGEKAREYWEEMAFSDPEELACIIGTETLIQWGLNQYASPGSIPVQNLAEWLDLWLDVPEEQWASYNGEEMEGCRLSPSACEELGIEFDLQAETHYCLYRHN